MNASTKTFNRILTIFTLIAVFAFSLIRPIIAVGTVINLGTADGFAILAGTGITNIGTTTVTGNVGSYEITTQSGFGSGANSVAITGTNHFGDVITQGAKTDLTAAYIAADQTCDTNLTGQDLGGLSLTPGVYCFNSSVALTGTLTLDGQNNPDAVFIFKIGSTLTTASGSAVNLIGSAQSCNVFWQVGSSATFGTTSAFVGNILALTSITLTTGASIEGRVLARNGAVTLDANIITKAVCEILSTPTPTPSVTPTPTTTPTPTPTPTVTPTPIVTPTPTPTTTPIPATINVVKKVINDNNTDNKKTADFPLFINGTLVISGETNIFPAPVAYNVTETTNPNYTRTFSGDCDADGHIDLAPGDNKFCVITNNDIAPSSGGNGGGSYTYIPPVPPLIDVVKVPSPLSLPDGPGLITYSYTLRNIGTVPVINITMDGDTCSPIILTSGDTNNNSKLDINETWVHHCTTTLLATHTNTVVATGWANGISAIDYASATVIVGVPIVPPLIHVTKIPNPLALLAGGGMVTYTYTVTNPGTEPLSNVNIIDDKCTGLPGRVVGHPGDLNKNNLLENNEAWGFSCQSNLTETTTNTGTASGEANGLIAKDFAIATVIVATAAPILPSTGFAPKTGRIYWNIIILSGILMLISASLIFSLKKHKI